MNNKEQENNRDWASCEFLVALPRIDAALECFANDPTYDNAVGLVREVRAPQSGRAGPYKGLDKFVEFMLKKWSYNLAEPLAEYRKLHPEPTSAVPVAYVDPQALVNFKSGAAKKEWMWAKPDKGLSPVFTPTPPASAEGLDKALIAEYLADACGILDRDAEITAADFIAGIERGDFDL